MDIHSSPDQQRPFSHYLLFSMIFLIVLVAAGITAIDYLQVKQNYERDAAFLQTQTETDLIQALNIIDSGFQLFDDSQNERMAAGFPLFMAEYERAGRNPARMDLASVKEKIGGPIDLYIINESGVITYSTYSPEIGLDFKTIPYFYEYLTKVRLSQGYFSDRVVNELATGQLRKYAYMPTPDHNYILEIGLAGVLINQQHSFAAYQKNIDQMVYLNPFVKEVVIYDVNKQSINRTDPLPDPATNALLDRIIAMRQGLEIRDSGQGTKTRYLFVDLKDEQYGSDVSRIVRITYDTTLIQKQLNDLLIAHFISAVFAIILGIIAAILVARFLARPVYQIVSDVNKIATGDLTHTISPTVGREFAILEESVNTMVSTLNETIEREKKNEEQYRRLVENIPDVVWTSTINGSTIYISRNIEAVYGYPAEVIYTEGHKVFQDRIHPEDLGTVQTAWKSLFTTKKFDLEYRIRHRDGRWIWLHDRSTAVYEKEGSWYADGIFSNITERKEAEEKLRHLYSELEERVASRTAELQKTEEAFRQANKKLNLLSSITRHDILNQLAIVTGYIQLAKGRISDPEAEKYLATAQKAAAVIDRHMVFTRLYENVGVHAPAWQNVRELVGKASEDLPQNTVSITVETGDLELFADPLLEKVFFTLLENSLRHGTEATEARISSLLTENGLTLMYVDNGSGVNPHEKERIFEWGYGKHTGFGLFLSREILAITGLSIRETGIPGVGARFEIFVPANAFRFSSPTP
jgi:PAS domain S-box-containing protein